ncbi:MAG: 50S ribosomal protein L11 methyltransferase [Paenibacillaceae bacterium]
MRWHEVTIYTTEEAIEMVTNFMHELGAGGVSIEESGTLNKNRDTSFGQLYDTPLNDIPEGRCEIKSYFSEGSEMERILTELDASLRMLSEIGIDTGSPRVEMKDVYDEDWADEWKKYFKPIRVSEKLTIKPTWEEYSPALDELVIEIDPGMAFGTGTHETTTLCLQTLERYIRGGEEIIDVGTGSGILAIAAIKLGAKHVLALDLDQVAVTVANENVALNRLEDRITVRKSDLLKVIESEDSSLGITLPVQIIVANILAEVIILFCEDVYNALLVGGTYIASGIIAAKETIVEDAMTTAGLTVIEKFYEQNWVAIVARKL